MSAYDVVSAASQTEVSPDVWRAYVDPEFRDFVPRVTSIDGNAAWIMPVATREFSRLTYVPIGFLALAAIFLLILHRTWTERAAEAPALHPAGVALGR